MRAVLYGAAAAWLLLGCLAPCDAGPGLARDYYIASLPGTTAAQNDRYRHWAGHMIVDEASKSNLFFWLVATDHRQPKDKLVIWLNGGPGCSSMDGMFLEIGPYQIYDVNGTLEVRDNPYSWTQYANLLFVDQPVGVGYSYADPPAYMHTEEEVATEFYNFLVNFMAAFPEYLRSDLYFAGESFAGIYIPYIVNGILKKNEAGAKVQFNLKGVAIGNGWIDPQRQYNGYVPFAEKYGLIGGEYKASALRHQAECANMYEKYGPRIRYPSCESILDEIINFSRTGGQMCINMYDVRLRDTVPNGGCGLFDWPPRLDEMKRFLSREDVKGALHADRAPQRGSWSECDESVASALDRDKSAPSYVHLPKILANMPVLLFSGDKDLICNHMGTELMIDALEWGGATGFQNKSGRTDWSIDGVPTGTLQTERNLTYAVIFDASHMVAVDKPVAMLELINSFIGVPTGTSAAPSGAAQPCSGASGTQTATAPKTGSTTAKRYYVAGGVVLVVVCIFAAVAGYLFYRGRRKDEEDTEARGEWHQLTDDQEADTEAADGQSRK
ncbi:Alpha/Beta hydrolase protein [Hyaloraphidium curvatum]|nr:Alpha/Beta hydrolase protein [Hyaloraphidium curvatum]